MKWTKPEFNQMTIDCPPHLPELLPEDFLHHSFGWWLNEFWMKYDNTFSNLMYLSIFKNTTVEEFSATSLAEAWNKTLKELGYTEDDGYYEMDN